MNYCFALSTIQFPQSQTDKSFLLLFFKKEVLSANYPPPRSQSEFPAPGLGIKREGDVFGKGDRVATGGGVEDGHVGHELHPVEGDPEVGPVAVRFAWHQQAEPNLSNKDGLPASPFRTDKWPLVEVAPAPAPTKK